MKFLLLVVLLAAIFVVLAALYAACEVLEKNRSRPRPKRVAPPSIAPYKKEDVTWLYAQGLNKDEIELLIRQNQGLK